MAKVFLICLGWLCVGFGVAGIFLPLLPTTPFLLVAAWAFAQSSPRFRTWLLEHPRLGPFIHDWHHHGTVPTGAKVASVTMMSLSMLWLALWSNAPTLVVVLVGICLACVAAFILTRPSRPKSGSP